MGGPGGERGGGGEGEQSALHTWRHLESRLEALEGAFVAELKKMRAAGCAGSPWVEMSLDRSTWKQPPNHPGLAEWGGPRHALTPAGVLYAFAGSGLSRMESPVESEPAHLPEPEPGQGFEK